MKAIVIISLLCLCSTGFAALNLPPTRRSEQFIVHDDRPPGPHTTLVKPREGGQDLVELGPDVLLISAERIREGLLKELKISPSGSGKIHLALNRASQGEDQIVIKPRFYAGRWQYRVEIPDRIDRLRLIRAIVGVLLFEVANRGSESPKSAEIPLWLVEGLSLRLLSSVGPALILQTVPTGFMARSIWELRSGDALREARDYLRSVKPLTFADLSHPSADQLAGSNLKLYQHSAQVFLHELCRLPNGQASLFQMLRELPYCWNTETAFLRAFNSRFQRLLDVEKWWSVSLIAFVGPELAQPWTVEACLEKLDDILLAPVDVRAATNALPVRRQVTLQQIVAEWDFSTQRPVLQHMLNQLLNLRYNAPLEVVPLIDDYRLSLHNYAQKRAQAGYGSSKRQAAVSATLVSQEMIKELDQLYRKREVVRRAQLSAAKTPASPP